MTKNRKAIQAYVCIAFFRIFISKEDNMETKTFITSSFFIERQVDEWLSENPDVYIVSTQQTQTGIEVLLIVIFKQLK